MDIVHGSYVLSIVLYIHETLLTYSEAFLFFCSGRVPYTIFSAAAEIFVAVYSETSDVYLSPLVMR